MSAEKSLYSLHELSRRFGLELRGDENHQVGGVGTLISANHNQITFLANRSYRKHLLTTQAGAVILRAEHADTCPTNCLIADDPYLAYARLARIFENRPAPKPGIHPSAVIATSAQLGEGVSIGANSVIGDDCQVGDGCSVGPGSVLEAGCRLGPGCRLFANVTLGYGVQLGSRVIVHPGAVIGADGFGIAFASDHWEKVPQLGTAIIGDDCEIGANSCIDRGAVGDTVLEEDVRVDNLVQIGHNVRIGAHTAIAGNSGIAGSCEVGKYCLIGGGAALSGHLKIADKTTFTGYSVVTHSVTEPGTTWSGTLPAMPVRTWNRNAARLRQLDELARKIRTLETKVGKTDKC